MRRPIVVIKQGNLTVGSYAYAFRLGIRVYLQHASTAEKPSVVLTLF